MQERCEELELKGTIILANEGINFTLAGEESKIEEVIDYLCNNQLFKNKFREIDIKKSYSETKPFGKMVVRIAKEIITMRNPVIKPGQKRAPSIEASKVKEWLKNGVDDDGNEVVMLDTRNTYETDIGTFDGAIKLEIESFGEFPDAIAKIADESKDGLKEKTIVSFCTGGIRCEKAALYMQDIDFQKVYQLEGGILKYLEEAGGEHWKGECFVFDDRIAVDSALQETKKKYTKEDIGS